MRKTPFKIRIGQKIKTLRKEADLTQQELGEKLGVGFTSIANYESGYSQPENETLTKLSNLFNVSVDYILGNTSINNPKQHLENLLSKYNLTQSEYDILFNDILLNNKINLSLLTSTDKKMDKIKQAYNDVFDVYISYLECNPVESENNINLDNDNIQEIYNQPLDNNFINMLKSIDKTKIIFEKTDDVFPTIDILKRYPVLGKISAGLPILAVENIESYEVAPSSYIKEGYDYFFLRVQGDSMNLEFPNNCLLLIQRQPILDKGEIGVFRINGDEATVKRFKEENGLIMLEPRSSNPIHDTQTYNPKEVEIEIIGKVVSYTAEVNKKR